MNRIHRLVIAIVVAAGFLAAPAASAAVVEPAVAPSRTVATVQPSKIVITRTATDTSVRLSWPKHPKATRYLVIASSDGDGIASATTRGTAATISKLDPAIHYTFIVTPMSAKASAKSMRAVMAEPLRGKSATTTSAPKEATTAAPAAMPVTASTPTSQSSGTSSTSAGPAAAKTKTVWECPDGYTEDGADCVKARAYTYHQETTTLPYTFHDETTTLAYTFHQQWVRTGSHFVGVARDVHGACVSPGREYVDGCGYFLEDGYYVSAKDSTPTGYADSGTAWAKTDRVKDAAPAGFADDGTSWVKFEQVKDATPVGFTDSGTQWVTRTAKVARQVPA